jgi:hypothetical protein
VSASWGDENCGRVARAVIASGVVIARSDTLEWALVQAYQNNPSLNARPCAPPMRMCRRRCLAAAQVSRHRQRRLQRLAAAADQNLRIRPMRSL